MGRVKSPPRTRLAKRELGDKTVADGPEIMEWVSIAALLFAVTWGRFTGY
jgi:hypothetical protein